jgi:hypothetical protein
MTELTELERLQKNVVETKAAYDKSRQALSNYLKEQYND